MKIMPAKDLAVVSKENYKLFEKLSLEGGCFRRLVNLIEEAALNGRDSVQFELIKGEDVRILPVFKKSLEEAGYKVKSGLFNASFLFIEWGS